MDIHLLLRRVRALTSPGLENALAEVAVATL